MIQAKPFEQIENMTIVYVNMIMFVLQKYLQTKLIYLHDLIFNQQESSFLTPSCSKFFDFLERICFKRGYIKTMLCKSPQKGPFLEPSKSATIQIDNTFRNKWYNNLPIVLESSEWVPLYVISLHAKPIQQGRIRKYTNIP